MTIYYIWPMGLSDRKLFAFTGDHVHLVFPKSTEFSISLQSVVSTIQYNNKGFLILQQQWLLIELNFAWLFGTRWQLNKIQYFSERPIDSCCYIINKIISSDYFPLFLPWDGGLKRWVHRSILVQIIETLSRPPMVLKMCTVVSVFILTIY